MKLHYKCSVAHSQDHVLCDFPKVQQQTSAIKNIDAQRYLLEFLHCVLSTQIVNQMIFCGFVRQNISVDVLFWNLD